MRTGIRTFYILALTQVFSMLGSAMSSFAIGVWVFAETGNTTPLFLIAFFSFLPRMFFGAIAGVFADRLNRKMLIIVGDAGQAIPTFLLAVAFATGTFALWQLYAAALVQAIFALAQGPALTASITMLVPDNHRDRANSLMAIMDPLSSVLAPALGAAFYGFIGVAGVLTFDLITFFVAVVVIANVHIPNPETSEESKQSRGSIWQEVKGSVQFLRERPGLLYLMLYFMAMNFITNGAFRMFTPFILSITNNDEIFLGILQTLFSIGLVVGGLIPMIWKGYDSRIKTVLLGLCLAALGMILFPMIRNPLPLLIMAFLMVLPYKLTNALLYSVMQAKIPADMQGRVFALTSQISVFAIPVIYLVTGPLVDNVFEPAVGKSGWQVVAPFVGSEAGSGMALYIIVCGLIFLAMTVFTYSLASVRHLEIDLPDYLAVPASPATVHGDVTSDNRVPNDVLASTD